MSRAARRISALLSALALAAPDGVVRGQGAPPVFRAATELVLVNVVVRDSSGRVVRGLTKNDFIVAEDGKPQDVSSFDFEELDQAASPAPAPVVPVLAPPSSGARPGAPASPGVGAAPGPAPRVDVHDRRLVVLFFDLSSMQPDEAQRAFAAARDYVAHRFTPADLVAVTSFSTSLRIDQDFTGDRASLSAAIDRLAGVAGQGFEEGGTGDTDGTPDDGTAFVADDTEFNIFNTDRRLDALQSLSDALAPIEQKKSVIYFSSGMDQNGSDNQVELRRTVDRAVRANVSIYAADVRGLQALPPGGDATTQSARGQSPFSGAMATSQLAGFQTTEDTLTTMAEETGGRAYFDTNAFGQVFQRVLADTSTYYILAYSSTNTARDGRYRRINVRVKRPGVRLEYRVGYYAARDFAHSTREDREQQLDDQLVSDLSPTDLATYVAAAYFREADGRFYVPLSVVVPGYQVPMAPNTGRDKASIDVVGIVRDAQKRPVARIRDTVRLDPKQSEALQRRIVQYQTGIELPPGRYRVKVVVRENVNGTFGSYETDLVVPDLKAAALETSSIVVGTQLQPGARADARNPLVRGHDELVPNVTHVVSPGQHLYFYYEIYDPARTPGGNPLIRVVTSVAFFRGKQRAFETPPVEAHSEPGGARKAVFELDVPAASLRPGLYTCQVNIVDDVAGTFAFPRMQVYVRP